MLVEGVSDYAIYMLDLDGNVENWNVGAQRAKGYLAEEIVGQHFSRFYSAQDRLNHIRKKTLPPRLKLAVSKMKATAIAKMAARSGRT